MGWMAWRPGLYLHVKLVVVALLIVMAACSNPAEPAPIQQAQAQPPAEPRQSEVQQVQDEPAQPEDDEAGGSAADAMSYAQPQSQAYSSGDPYAADDHIQQDAQGAAAPLPLRQWLAEGISLAPSAAAAFDEYGWSIVIESDVIASSAPYHDAEGEDSGAVFIFERIDGEWLETAKLLPPFPDPLGWFGRWLAIDAGRIVIGAPYEDGLAADGSRIDDSGVAYVYENVRGEWARTGTLLPAVASGGASFGWSVAISGDRIAVSAWEDVVDGVASGSVTVFRQHKGLWWVEAVLTPNRPTDRQMFGRDIELDGNVLAVGAPGDDTIAEDAGAVFVWHYYSGEWNFAGKLLASDSIESDRLGSQIALDGDWLVSGAHDHDLPYWSAGATYVWKLNRLWEFHSKLSASDAQPGDWFGYATALDGERMVIGAPHRAHPETQLYRSGAAYVFELRDDEWIEAGVLGPVDAIEAGERAEFGWAVDVSDVTVTVGAWLADTSVGEDAGESTVYEISANPPEPMYGESE